MRWVRTSGARSCSTPLNAFASHRAARSGGHGAGQGNIGTDGAGALGAILGGTEMARRSLLAYQRGATIPCRQILEDRWPDRDEAHARSSLRNAVHQIRGLLRGYAANDRGGNLKAPVPRYGQASIWNSRTQD